MSFKESVKYKLTDLYSISSGLSKGRKDFGFGYPFVSFKDVFYNFFLPDELENLANTSEKERLTCSVEKGDLFLTRTSETQEELGMSSVALKDYHEATFNGFTKRLRLKSGFENKVDPLYIGYYMRSPKVRNQINGLSIMTTRASLNNSMIDLIEIEIPNLIEQKLIGAMLYKIDKKIEVNNQINKTLENMAQAIFKQWFVDFDFPNEDGEPYQSSGGEMVESELGMIPKGWEVVEFVNIVKIDTKNVKPFDNKDLLYEHYSIPALDANSYPCFEYGGEIKSNKYMVYEDSILISKLNPSTKRIWLPLCLSNRAICSTEFINFRPLDVKLKAFVYSIINSDRFTEYLMNHVTGSTGSRQRVKPSDTLKYKFVMPKHDIAIEFNQIIESIYKKTNNNLIENQNLKVVRDALLPKLMSGEIRVSLDSEGEVS